MKTLEQCYSEISKNSALWSYYTDPPVSIIGRWKPNEDSLQFIKDYFNYAGKSSVFDDNNLKKNEIHIKYRSPHIISTFLLGIKIAECFEIDIGHRDERNMNFKYYWFLTCLYHDIGYAYENNFVCEHFRVVGAEGFEGLQEICEIQYLHNREFKTYPKELVELYLKCRADCQKSQPKLDHGIVGGLLLYDKLRKQFARAWKNRTEKADCRDNFYCMHEATGRKLHLSNKHFDAYAKAADAIIAHNIWKSTLQQYLQDYADFNPKKYESCFKKRISKKNKLCFILSLADTIEPLKRNPQCLQEVSIEPLKQSGGFCLETNHAVFKELYSRINGLEEWLAVKVTTKDIFKDKVCITIEAE